MKSASTITMTTQLTRVVNIELAFSFLSLIHPRTNDGSRFVHPENTRDKIPFFGIPSAIVCIKYKGKIRGIRKNEGQMNNVVSIDLQNDEKNINLKLARTNLQLTGANSEESGTQSFLTLCSHISMAQGHIEYIRSLSSQIKESTVNFVLQSIESMATHILPEMNIEMISYLASKHSEIVDVRMAAFLWQYVEDFETFSPFKSKIEFIMNVVNSDLPEMNIILQEDEEHTGPLTIKNVNISNSVYNYSLGKEVSLIQLSTFLLKKGFSIDYHPWNSSAMKVSIPIIDDEDDDDSSGDNTIRTVSSGNSKNKIKAHRFSCSHMTSIKQTSPTSKAHASQAYELFMSGINAFFEENPA